MLFPIVACTPLFPTMVNGIVVPPFLPTVKLPSLDSCINVFVPLSCAIKFVVDADWSVPRTYVVFLKIALPLTSNVAVGVPVPIPTNPPNEAVEAVCVIDPLNTAGPMFVNVEEPDTVRDPVIPKDPVIKALPVYGNVGVTGAYEALKAVVAYEAVPSNEPVALTVEPETVNAGAPYVPITTLSSENTSKIGKPETSFTDIKEPDKASVTENNWPWEP